MKRKVYICSLNLQILETSNKIYLTKTKTSIQEQNISSDLTKDLGLNMEIHQY